MKNILVCGAGGFIGTHLINSLKELGHYVIGADLKYPEFSKSMADEFFICDLSQQSSIPNLFKKQIDEIYQLAADMGGAGYAFTGDNDANIMSNSVLINANILRGMVENNVKKVFYSSSACVYPFTKQNKDDSKALMESDAYPAFPDSDYGWEKLFSERLYRAYSRNFNITAKIARLHNIYGPLGSWNNGKEKVIAALCRKVISADNQTIEVWGDGNQRRSFLFIDECISGIHKFMDSDFHGPLNIGSNRAVSINELVRIISAIEGKKIRINYVDGPIGVANRNSDNTLIKEKINWVPSNDLEHGVTITYHWILNQFKSKNIDDNT